MSLYARLQRAASLFLMAASLAACAGTNGSGVSPDGINDPLETQNRKIHEFNKNLDRKLVRPLAHDYANAVPDGVEESVSNFATNLGQPAVMVNSLLQGDLKGVGVSALRFTVNSTVGVLGLFDAATDMTIVQHDTDFGETLFVWGVGEGAYHELPVLGPSTARRTTGRIVDLFTNPLSYVLDSPEEYFGTVASVGSGLSARAKFSDTVDSVLYESADSYAQARLIYLQNRRFTLGDEADDAEIDPFELDTEGF
ncbi:MAG: VacJ family lipoprotein [Tateyamaria sp.]|uniref:MlaA family lipoprotein n=2 Tax=Tateyamaria sp. TaxID=1929288 RepID=UPI0032A06413